MLDDDTNIKDKYGGEMISKWIAILVFAFLVFVIISTIMAYYQGAFAAEKKSFLSGTNATDVTWGSLSEEEEKEEIEELEKEDEKEHERESKEWAKYADSEEANDDKDDDNNNEDKPYPNDYYDENGNPRHGMSDDELAEYNRNADKEHE